MAVKYLRERDFRSQESFLNALFPVGAGGGRTFEERLSFDQQNALVTETDKLDRGRVFPDRWDRIEYNSTRAQNSTLEPRDVMARMKFGTYGGLYGGEAEEATGLVEALRDIKRMLEAASPIRTHFYAMNHEIWVDGAPLTGAGGSKVTADSWGLVINRTEYASTLEAPDFSKTGRTYDRTVRKAAKKYGSTFDISGDWVDPYKGYGGHKRRQPKNTGKYVVPVIVLVPLNVIRDSARRGFRPFAGVRRRKLKGGAPSTLRQNILARMRRGERGNYRKTMRGL